MIFFLKTRNLRYLVLIFFFLSSCSFKDKYKNATLFTFKDFKTTKDVKSRNVVLDSMVMEPYSLSVVDSMLLVIESGRDKHVYVYDLKRKKQIIGRIDYGQGPSDMLMPQIVGHTDKTISIFDFEMSKLFDYDKESFLKKGNIKPLKVTKIGGAFTVDVELLNNKLLGTCSDKCRQIRIIDIITNKSKYIAPYPISNVDFSTTEKQQAFYMNFTTNKINRLAIAYYMTDLLEFYSLKGDVRKRLYGPENFISRFKRFSNGNFSGARPVKGANRKAYFCPQYSEDSFYVLYNGKAKGEKNYSSSCNKLFSFSWDGIPQTIYNLDVPIFNFTIDEKQNKIYGIANEPEYRIVEYDL